MQRIVCFSDMLNFTQGNDATSFNILIETAFLIVQLEIQAEIQHHHVVMEATFRPPA